jgi:hypothetical protein
LRQPVDQFGEFGGDVNTQPILDCSNQQKRYGSQTRIGFGVDGKIGQAQLLVGLIEGRFRAQPQPSLERRWSAHRRSNLRADTQCSVARF